MSPSPDYHFEGGISREVLENYLDRSITMGDLCASPQREDDLRMLANIKPKFIGRLGYLWSQYPAERNEEHFQACAEIVEAHHRVDPEAVFQCCIFEAVYPNAVGGIAVPAWVFEEFGQPVEARNFNFDAMLYDENCARQLEESWCPHPGNNFLRDKWRFWHGVTGAVPDMSKLETQMWFYYRARRYLDLGVEGLHLGQIHLMDHNDLDYAHWWSLLERIRSYARAHARRGAVIIDAHTPGVALADGRLLFDFHSYPMYPRQLKDQPQHCDLVAGHRQAVYGRSLGGTAPSGWACEHLPMLIEFDNWGPSGRPGEYFEEMHYVWGYDEINWLAALPEAERNDFVRYAWKRIPELDPNCHLQMPGQRNLAAPIEGKDRYFANTRSAASPTGFNTEETIKAIWEGA
ncbi:MAG: hypothetical protein AAGK14_01705 [Verrucomicrobiota bacterium]